MIIKREFDGLEALATIAAPRPRQYEGENYGGKPNYLASRAENTGYRSEWYGGTFEEALRMARYGWPEGAAKARKLLDKLEVPILQSVTSEIVYDVTGSYVDVGEYVQGVPECMVDFKEDKRRARFASILVSGVIGSNLSVEALINRGVCIAALVDTLERSNIRCEVSLLFLNKRQDNILEYSLTLKRAHDPLNLDVLTYGIAHPTCFRRLIFGAYEHEPNEVRAAFGIHHGGGYGSVTRVSEIEGTIVFQSPLADEKWGPTESLRKINSIIAKFRGTE